MRIIASTAIAAILSLSAVTFQPAQAATSYQCRSLVVGWMLEDVQFWSQASWRQVLKTLDDICGPV